MVKAVQKPLKNGWLVADLEVGHESGNNRCGDLLTGESRKLTRM
jgi:hypothetical protein